MIKYFCDYCNQEIKKNSKFYLTSSQGHSSLSESHSGRYEYSLCEEICLLRAIENIVNNRKEGSDLRVLVST